MADQITAESIVAQLLQTLATTKAEAEASKKAEVKAGHWFLERDKPEQTRGDIRTLVPFISELDLWRLSVPKCWPYHPRTVRGLLAAKARCEQVNACGSPAQAVGFYTLTLRDVREQLLSFELEREHLIGTEEVATLDDLEEFLASPHFDILYGTPHDGSEVAA